MNEPVGASKTSNGSNPNDMGFFITCKRHCSWEALINIQGVMLGNSTKRGLAKAQKMIGIGLGLVRLNKA